MAEVSSPGDRRALLRDALVKIKELQTRLRAAEQARSEPIAIVGIGCRFPGADRPSAFWRRLREGVDAVGELPSERWDGTGVTGTNGRAPRPAGWAATLANVDRFDADFFGITSVEAERMDPQQRIVLEVAWEALEDAGLVPGGRRGERCGVFVGVYQSDYLLLQAATGAEVNVYTGPGSAHSIVANRLSYLLDLHGPSLAVDTACSSSLVAVHLACQSLRSRECNMALAGGVNLILSPLSTLVTSRVLSLAADGRCKAFDARADGIVRGEGCALVVLKRLSDALADGDRIVALVRGSAVNQDGRTNGLTAPNPLAQEALIRRALEDARVAPADVDFIEAHGTGTPLGDPIEIEALNAVYGPVGGAGRPCAVGSVKTNIGHLEAAAGIAGLVKAALALRHGEIPPSLHLQTLNPNISLDGSRLTIPIRPVPWPVGQRDRFAAVSSFGFGGTNAHVILEGAPARGVESGDAQPQPAGGDDVVLPLSARSEAALADLALAYRELLVGPGDGPSPALGDLVYSAAVRRAHHPYRLVVQGRSTEQLAEKLDRWLKRRAVAARPEPAVPARLAFVFSGQGSQWPGMARDLLAREPVFRREVEACDAELRRLAEWSLIEELQADEQQSRVEQTEIAQLAIFAVQAGLVALWRSWGIQPEAVVGHSVGEVAAAWTAGALNLGQAVRLLFHRGRLMQRAAPGGRMVAVGLVAEQVEPLLDGYPDQVAIAALNGARATVISGQAEAVDEIAAGLRASGASVQVLPIVGAFHSPRMEPIKEALALALASLEPGPGHLPLYSTVTGGRIDGRRLGAEYWGRNLREPVRFTAAIQALVADGHNTFVEVGPQAVLVGYLSEALGDRGTGGLVLPSLRRKKDGRTCLLNSLGSLYAAGCDVNWGAVYSSGRYVDLPTYPWQRRRYWIRMGRPVARSAPANGHDAATDPSPDRARPAGPPAPSAAALEPEALTELLRERVAAMLGLDDPTLIGVDEPLDGLGLESLMVVELKNQVEQELGLIVPMTALRQGRSVAEVAALLCGRSSERPEEPAVEPRVEGAVSPEAARSILRRLGEMSDAEVDAALEAMLKGAGNDE